MSTWEINLAAEGCVCQPVGESSRALAARRGVATPGRCLPGCLLPAPGWLGSRQPTSSASSNGAAGLERLLESWSRLRSAAVSSSQPRLAQSKTLQPWRGCAGTETGVVIGFPAQPLQVEPGFGQLVKCPCPERVMYLGHLIKKKKKNVFGRAG